MLNSTQLLIVIAAYNEIESLPELVVQLLEMSSEARVLVIEDLSADGTGAWCDRYAATQDRFSVVHRVGKLGLGSATRLGLRHGLESGVEFVATMDADLSHDPKQLWAMFEWLTSRCSSGYGAIIGSRYVAGGQIVGWPWNRRLASAIVNGYSRLVLRLPNRDNTSALRIYRTAALRELDFDRLHCDGYVHLEEILWAMKHVGIRTAEFPITFRNRSRGHSKVNFIELARSLWDLARLSLRPTKRF